MAAASNAARELAKRALALYTSNGHGVRRRGVTEAVEKFQRKPSDTGSPEVQIALISSRILHLTEHLKKNRKDHASARAVVALVHKRRSQMQYLLRKKPELYADVVQRLGLRPTTVFAKDLNKGAKKRHVPQLNVLRK